MIGAGGIARTYVEAIKHVRPLEVVRVFSPTKKNHDAYAAEMTEKLDIEFVAVDSPEKAVDRNFKRPFLWPELYRRTRRDVNSFSA